MDVLKTLGTAIVAFAATNVDDLVVLLTYFSESLNGSSSLQPRHVVIGQYIGMILLISISLGGYGASYFLPAGLVGFLGFVPIILGLKMLFELIKERYNGENSEDSEQSVRPYNNLEEGNSKEDLLKSDVPSKDSGEGNTMVELSIESETTNELSIAVNIPNNQEISKWDKFKSAAYDFSLKFLSPQVLKVAGTTIGNGGDNIGIYIPLFSQARNWQVALSISVFLVCVAVWCAVTYLLVSRPFVLNWMQKYGQYIVPFVLIGLGLFIVIDSHCFPWLVQVIKNKHWGEYEGK